MEVKRYSSGGPWEDLVGYSRAVQVGPWILVAGSTSTVDGHVVHIDDPYQQTMTAFAIALEALAHAGAGPQHVVRTRMYVTDMEFSEAVGRAHRDIFDEIRPAATMVAVAGLAHQDHLVEVEVDAYFPEDEQ